MGAVVQDAPRRMRGSVLGPPRLLPAVVVRVAAMLFEMLFERDRPAAAAALVRAPAEMALVLEWPRLSVILVLGRRRLEAADARQRRPSPAARSMAAPGPPGWPRAAQNSG